MLNRKQKNFPFPIIVLAYSRDINSMLSRATARSRDNGIAKLTEQIGENGVELTTFSQ